MPAADDPVLAEVRQDSCQVVDVHLAVAGEVALAPSHPGLAEVRQDDVRSLMLTRLSRLASPGRAA